MAMAVTRDTSSVGRRPAHGSFERVAVSWEMDASGIASDTIMLSGVIHQAILVPGTTAPSDTYVVRLYDPDDPAIDYTCGGWTGHSDLVSYLEPCVISDRCPAVCGSVVFHVSDANSSDADGVVVMFLKS